MMTLVPVIMFFLCQTSDSFDQILEQRHVDPACYAALMTDELPRTMHRLKRVHSIFASNVTAIEGIRIIRADVAYSSSEQAESLKPESEFYPSTLLAPEISRFSFIAWCIVCFDIMIWFIFRRRKRRLVAIWLLPLAIIPITNVVVRYQRREHDRLAPPVVISNETDLRAGNGVDYPAKIHLPQCVECRKIGERGDWLQVEFASGLTGWIEKRSAIVAATGP